VAEVALGFQLFVQDFGVVFAFVPALQQIWQVAVEQGRDGRKSHSYANESC
jgi:hypothetical protein